jgi:hypothetical protein
LWTNHIGDHPQEELAKFGYRSERKLKIENWKNLATFWCPIGTYCPKFGDSFFLNPRNFVILAHLFQKCPLYNLHYILLVAKWNKFIPKKTTHWTNLITEVWALITLKEVGLGMKKSTPCHHRATWKNTMELNSIKRYDAKEQQYDPHLCTTNTFVSMKIETPLPLKLEMWDGPRPFFHTKKITWLRKYINCE